MEPGSSMSHADEPPPQSTVVPGVQDAFPQSEHTALIRVGNATSHLSVMQLERLRRAEVPPAQVDTRKANYVV
eukprot:IDg19945t1